MARLKWPIAAVACILAALGVLLCMPGPSAMLFDVLGAYGDGPTPDSNPYLGSLRLPSANGRGPVGLEAAYWAGVSAGPSLSPDAREAIDRLVAENPSDLVARAFALRLSLLGPLMVDDTPAGRPPPPPSVLRPVGIGDTVRTGPKSKYFTENERRREVARRMLRFARESGEMEPDNAYWWLEALYAAQISDQPAVAKEMFALAAKARTYDDRAELQAEGMQTLLSERLGGATGVGAYLAHSGIRLPNLNRVASAQYATARHADLRARSMWCDVARTIMSSCSHLVGRFVGVSMVRRAILGLPNPERGWPGRKATWAEVQAEAERLDSKAQAKGIDSHFVESVEMAGAVRTFRRPYFGDEEALVVQRAVWRRIGAAALLLMLLALPAFAVAAFAPRIVRTPWVARVAAYAVVGGVPVALAPGRWVWLSGTIIVALGAWLSLTEYRKVGRGFGWAIVGLTFLLSAVWAAIQRTPSTWWFSGGCALALLAYWRLDAVGWGQDGERETSWTHELTALAVPTAFVLAWLGCGWRTGNVYWIAPFAAMFAAELLLASPKAKLRPAVSAWSVAVPFVVVLVSLGAMLRIDLRLLNCYKDSVEQQRQMDEAVRAVQTAPKPR